MNIFQIEIKVLQKKFINCLESQIKHNQFVERFSGLFLNYITYKIILDKIIPART
jgi:hypothetical protein